MRSRLTLAVALGVIAAGGLVASPLAVAQESTGSPVRIPQPAPDPDTKLRTRDVRQSWQERREDLVASFAEELGVSVEEVEAAWRTVAEEQLKLAVEDGLLSEERADRLRERLDDTEGLGFGFGPGPSGDRPGPRDWFRGRFRSQEEVTGATADRAAAAALDEVAGEVLRVVRVERGAAAYAVAVRPGAGEIALVLLDADFGVVDTYEYDRGRGRHQHPGSPSTPEETA